MSTPHELAALGGEALAARRVEQAVAYFHDAMALVAPSDSDHPALLDCYRGLLAASRLDGRPAPTWPAGTVDAVLLDAGGVLLLPDPEALRRGFDPLGARPDDETCRQAHYASMRELDRIGGPDWARVDRVLARVAGVPEVRIDDVVEHVEAIYLREPWVPAADAAEALIALQAAGYGLAVVSNASGTIEEQLATHEICRVGGGEAAHVEIVVDSDIVGIEKPDPRIFDIALAALGLAASRCLYIGDTVHFDVEGARAAGLVPVHVDPFGLCPGHDHPHVRSLAELAAGLGAAVPR